MSDPVARLNQALEGRYQIERELGEGGMATVYLAKDLKHNRNVALKVLKPELAAVVGAERFLAEIQVTANLQHPHILPLHDSGEADGFLFYVMPYVEGETLRDRIDREKQLPVDEAVALASKVAGALHHAHEHGVIHRDIKPANILLQDSEPVVADFGIALAVGAAGSNRLTETGLSLGTPYYMSPEQATGDQAVGASTDTYALGSVLYEMLVGDPPFAGSTAQAVLGKIIAGKSVSAMEERPSVPPNVDAAVRCALEKLPADRFASAQEFVKALGDEHFRYGELATAGEGAAVGPWKRLTMAGWSAAAVLAVAFGWSVLRTSPLERPETMRQVLSTEGWAGLDVEIGRYMALAPDGSSMILPVGNQLALKMRGSTEITPIPGTEQGRDVVYSPDGQSIAYAVGTDLFTQPIVGGSPVRVAEDAEGSTFGLDWLDDGTILYEQLIADLARSRRIVQIPENGGEPVVVFWPEEEDVAPVWVHGLPSGRGALVIACLQRAGVFCSADVARLYVVDLRDLSFELVLEQVIRAWYTPTGHLVYVRSDGAVFALPFDLDALTITGSAIPLFDGVRVTLGWADMRLAPDGTLLYVEGSSAGSGLQQLLVVDLDGNVEALPLTPRPITGLSVGWSPDGESIVFVSEGQIYTYDLLLNATRQITFEGTNGVPVFSPDGATVAFSSQRPGTDGADLFVKALNDASPPRPLITLSGDELLMQWPMDTLIVFERAEPGRNRELWMLDLSDPDAPQERLYLESENDLRRISVSPDGTLAAYRSSEDGGSGEIYVRTFPDPGAQELVSRTSAFTPFWSPDGATLYYAVAPGQPMIAAHFRTDPVPLVLSTDTLFYIRPSTREPMPGSGLHPDGDRFILTVNAEPESSRTIDPSRTERLILVQNWFEELRERMGN